MWIWRMGRMENCEPGASERASWCDQQQVLMVEERAWWTVPVEVLYWYVPSGVVDQFGAEYYSGVGYCTAYQCDTVVDICELS